jgi:hypothetical protein
MPLGSNNGADTTPLWSNDNYLTGNTASDCAQCHGLPPNVPPHTGTETIVQCAACHDHFEPDGTLNNAALHIDGLVQAQGTCNSCHGYPPVQGDGFASQDGIGEGKGAHLTHVNNIAAAKGVILDPANDTFGAGTAGIVCGTCHTINAANHMTGTRIINFADGSTEYQFGPGAPNYNGVPGTSSTVTLKSCSNISCHYGDTPGWQDPATAGP